MHYLWGHVDEKKNRKYWTIAILIFLMIILWILRVYYAECIAIEFVCDVLVGFITGITSGYIVSNFFDKKNKEEEIFDYIQYTSDKLIDFSQFFINDDEMKNNYEAMKEVGNDCQRTLNKIRKYIENTRHKELTNEIDQIIEILREKMFQSQEPSNSEFDRRDILKCFIKLIEIKRKLFEEP